jgi:hypothetical protein
MNSNYFEEKIYIYGISCSCPKLVTSDLSIREPALSWKTTFVGKVVTFPEHEKKINVK